MTPTAGTTLGLLVMNGANSHPFASIPISGFSCHNMRFLPHIETTWLAFPLPSIRPLTPQGCQTNCALPITYHKTFYLTEAFEPLEHH